MDNLNELLKDSNHNGLGEFLDKNVDRLLNDWSYASGTSNHALLGAHTHSLVKTFEICSKTPVLQRYSGTLAQGIIRDHMRVIYRSLFLTRPRQTVPAIRLLEELSKVSADALYNTFDLNLKVIPKLLSSKDFREPFIRFYIAFLTNVGPIARKDLVHQKKIVKAWLSRLHEDSSDDLVNLSLDCMGKCVLRNRLLNKSHKLSFFNDSLLQSLVKLLSRSTVALAASAFFTSLFCDVEFGVVFHDNGWYNTQPNNKLTLSFLFQLRPWDGTVQMDLCIHLLSTFSELVYPYFEHLAKTYPFLPKVSSFWFNYAVLHSRVVQIPIADLDSMRKPDDEVVAAAILPQPLTKSHLNAAISFKDNALLAFQSAQIVQHALSKLKKVLEVYETNVWDPVPLLANLQERLPSIQLLSSEAKPSLLQTCLLSCAAKYYEVFGANTTVSLPASVSSILDSAVGGLDLVQAQSILKIQTTVLSSTRWYNKSGDEHSFFTRLLKFALMNPAMAASAASLLKSLVSPLLMLQTKTVAHPIDALVYTLETIKFESSQEPKLWNLIDEAVSRSARSPYSYIDKFPVLLSPFAAALVEQLAFVKGAPQVEQWVAAFLRALQVLGEDAAACSALSEGLTMGKLPLDDYFEFVLSEKPAKVLARNDILLKISNKLELMATIQRACSSPELAEHLFESIPPVFSAELTDPCCFTPVLKSNPTSVQAYIKLVLQFKVSSTELTEALAASEYWLQALEMLPVEFLVDNVREGKSVHECIAELTSRAVPLPLDLIRQHLDEIEHLRILSLDQTTAIDLVKSCTSPLAVSAIVQSSKYYQTSFGTSPEILIAAATYASNCISENEKHACLDVAYGLIATNPKQALPLCVAFLDLVASDKVQPLFNTNEVLQPSLAILARKCHNQKWVDQVVLALTKLFSEKQNVATSEQFLIEFAATLEQTSLLAQVASDSVNALFSSVVKRLDLGSSTVLLTFLASVITPQLKSSRYLHKLLDYEPGFFEDKLLFGILIWKLFNCNEAKNSTVETQVGILKHYSGTACSADAILLEVLKIIERNISVSWVDNVIFWDLQSKLSQEYDRPALLSIIERGNKFQVTLCEDLISESADCFDPTNKFVINDSVLLKTQMQEFDILHPSKGYAPEFLISCITSCDQLVKAEALDVKVLCEMGLLPFVLCCLGSADPNVYQSAQLILESMAASIATEKYKESIAVTLVVGKALVFLHQHPRMPAHLAIMVGQVAKIAINPGHFLHEKASDWLMSGPSVQPYDLPLFEAISGSSSFHKGQELLWIIKTLSSSLVDSFTVKLYLKHGVLEWVLAQLNLIGPKSRALRHAAQQMLTRAEIFGGSNGLIKRAAALSIEPSYILLKASSIDTTEWMGYR